jgi:hypothetical protein
LTFLNVITSANVIVAIMIFGIFAIVEPFVESWLQRIFIANRPFQWGWAHFFAPLLWAIMLVVFVYLAFPAIFGLTTAPTIIELLSGDQVTVSNTLGVLFLFGIFASQVPGFGARPEFVLPIQGCLACGYLFFALTSYLGVTTATLWPGIDVFLAMICVSYFADRLGRTIGIAGGNRLDAMLNTDGYDVVILNAIRLLAQIPVILSFGYGLGRQLAI